MTPKVTNPTRRVATAGCLAAAAVSILVTAACSPRVADVDSWHPKPAASAIDEGAFPTTYEPTLAAAAETISEVTWSAESAVTWNLYDDVCLATLEKTGTGGISDLSRINRALAKTVRPHGFTSGSLMNDPGGAWKWVAYDKAGAQFEFRNQDMFSTIAVRLPAATSQCS